MEVPFHPCETPLEKGVMLQSAVPQGRGPWADPRCGVRCQISTWQSRRLGEEVWLFIRLVPMPDALPVPQALRPMGRDVHAEDAVTAPLRYALFPRYDYFADCGLLVNRKIESSKCRRKYQWICKQPLKLSSTSETLLPLLGEE